MRILRLARVWFKKNVYRSTRRPQTRILRILHGTAILRILIYHTLVVFGIRVLVRSDEMLRSNLVIVVVGGSLVLAIGLLLSRDVRIRGLHNFMESQGLRFSNYEIRKLMGLISIRDIRKEKMVWMLGVIVPYIDQLSAMPPDLRVRSVSNLEFLLHRWRNGAWFARPREDRSTEFVRYLLSSFPEIDAGIRAACESELAYIESRVKA